MVNMANELMDRDGMCRMSGVDFFPIESDLHASNKTALILRAMAYVSSRSARDRQLFGYTQTHTQK